MLPDSLQLLTNFNQIQFDYVFFKEMQTGSRYLVLSIKRVNQYNEKQLNVQLHSFQNEHVLKKKKP